MGRKGTRGSVTAYSVICSVLPVYCIIWLVLLCTWYKHLGDIPGSTRGGRYFGIVN